MSIVLAAVVLVAIMTLVLCFMLAAVYDLLVDVSERIDAIWGEMVDDEFGDVL